MWMETEYSWLNALLAYMIAVTLHYVLPVHREQLFIN
jgi:hypothetical protein